MVAVVGAGVAGHLGAPAAEHLPDGRVVEFAGEVPEGAVHRAHAHPVRLAAGALDVVVDQFPLQRIATEQVVREHRQLRHRRRIAAVVFARHARVRLDGDDMAGIGEFRARLVHLIEAVVIHPEVIDRVLVLMDTDARNLRLPHGFPPSLDDAGVWAA